MQGDSTDTYTNPYDPTASIPGVSLASLGLSQGPTPASFNPATSNTFASGIGSGPGGFPNINPNPPAFDPSAWQATQAGLAQDPSNPYYQDLNATQRGQWGNLVRFVPGAMPGTLVLPGTNIVYNTGGQQQDPSTLDPETQRMAALISSNPGNIPTLSQATQNGYQFTGRGFHLRGSASPQEQALLNAFLAGDNSAYYPLAQARMKRWAVDQPSGIQQIASKVYGPLLVSLMGGMVAGPVGTAYGALAGAGAGAGFGGLTAGGMSNWNPKSTAIGAAAGGVVGGVGGAVGQGAAALGASPGTSAVAGGVAGGAAGSTLQGGAQGNLDWRNVLAGAAGGGIGAGVGYGVGRLGSSPASPGAPVQTGGYVPPSGPTYNPYAQVISQPAGRIAGTATGIGVSDLLNANERAKRRLNPYKV